MRVSLEVGLGANTYQLEVRDGQGLNSTDTVEVSLVDTRPPEVSLELVPRSDRKNIKRFTVDWMVEDLVDANVDVVTSILVGSETVAISKGQEFLFNYSEDEVNIDSNKNRLIVVGPGMIVRLEAVDFSGNETVVENNSLLLRPR